ncbi:MAG: nucleoside phosphorylase [Omnitrophica WOR_2 bacterium]
MEYKPGSEEIMFSVKDLQRWRWRINGAPGIEPPGTVIFCLQPDLLRAARRRYALKPVKGFFGECFLLKYKHSSVMLAGGVGVGAPGMAIMIEECIAFGIRRFISIGAAGAIQPYLKTGDVIACDRAIRGEGTSGHYLPPSFAVEADPGLLQEVCSGLASRGIPFHQGTSWSTDAPYRETRKEASAYRQAGVLAVEMEAAACLAAARGLGAQAAAVLVVADRLMPTGWEPPEKISMIQKSLRAALGAAISYLALIGDNPEYQKLTRETP